MTAPLTGPETSAAEQSRMEFQAKLNGLGGLNGRQLTAEAREKKLREACEGFESIFIQKMWQEMRNAVPRTGILTGREERFWQDMYDQELSKSMTKAGGIGLADMMYEQLSRNLVSASRSAAGQATGGAFVPTAASLFQEEAEPEALAQAPGQAASIYEGEAPEMGEVAGDAAPVAANAPAANPVAAPQAAPAQASAAQPEPLQVAQVAPQAAQPAPLRAEATKAEPVHHIRKADLGQSSGLQMAQKARREAGDKLGSRAVRPSQQRKASRVKEQPEAVASTPMPGSADALKAAVEMAKTGAAPNLTATQPLDLGAMVANAQAMNFAAAQPGVATANVAAAQATGNDSVEEAGPVTRTVRFTTNVPQKADNRKKSKQAIRMLNVDNVGVNSRQGKGIAAYHAQQEAMRVSQGEAAQAASPASGTAPLAAAQPAPLTAENVASQAPIPPLTAQGNAPGEAVQAGFNVPPLTANGIRG